MPYRLIKGIFAVRCRHAQCPFHDQIKIEQDIVGVTEEDVRSEAIKMARDQAMVKHDSLYGRKHALETPEIRMASGTVQKLGVPSGHGSARQKSVIVRRFGKGEVILKKGEAAPTVCEILEGSAYPLANKSHRYAAGDCFGVAALVPNQTRLSDVIAAADGTTVAFYDLGDLRKIEPGRASRVVSQIMADTLRVVEELGEETPQREEQDRFLTAGTFPTDLKGAAPDGAALRFGTYCRGRQGPPPRRFVQLSSPYCPWNNSSAGRGRRTYNL